MGRYAGSDWLRGSKYEVGELGAKVADILGELFYGLYHVDPAAIEKADWKNEHHIEILLYSNGWSTFDFDTLTRFVVLCHDFCVRGEIAAARNSIFRVYFHPREREGGMSDRHPTMEDGLSKIRASFSIPTQRTEVTT